MKRCQSMANIDEGFISSFAQQVNAHFASLRSSLSKTPTNKPTNAPKVQNRGTPALAPSGGSRWDRMVGTESQGRQFGSNGKTLTSKAGAVGAAQIMPRYGPEFAKRAGVPWDAKRALTDRDYNLKLGKSQFDYLVKSYKGNDELAAAAYNAGKARVDAAVLRGRQTGTDWRNHLPNETRNYLRSTKPTVKEQIIDKVMEIAVGHLPKTPIQIFESKVEGMDPMYTKPLTTLFESLDENRRKQMALSLNEETLSSWIDFLS